MNEILTSIQRVPFEWVEIDQPLCTRTYGDTPCAAILGTTGENKCYNTRASCQDPDNFDGSGILTLRFCHNRGVIPDDYYYFPYLAGASVSPASINPGGGDSNKSALGTRAMLSCNFTDHPHTDLLVDPYVTERSWNPYERSTFWAKWRARNPYYLHRVIRHKSAYIDPATGHPDPATLITRTFFIVGFSGPDSDGNVTIQARDLLTLAANEKAKAPFPSAGKLLSAITDIETTATLTPTGIGEVEYPASGKIRIDGEVCAFSRTGDVLTLTRARNNTRAEAHDANATVQLCLEYSAESPPDILFDLLTTYAGIDAAYLDTTQWATETADFLPRLYSAIVTEPTGVTELIGEMCEQMYFAAYWDERQALLKIRAVRPAQDETITYLGDESNLLENSVQWVDRADQLITQVWIYYAQKNPTDSTTDARNFAALDIVADTDSEGEDRNNTSKIKTVFSRWLSSADGAAAIELGEKILERYNQIPREVSFSLDAKDRALWLGDFISIDNRQAVDFTGEAKPVPMQVISAQESMQGTIYQYVASEYLGTAIVGADGVYTIAISADMVNLNLYTLFNSLYSVLLTYGDTVKFTIRSGVTIGSACTDEAFPDYLSDMVYAKAFSISSGAWQSAIRQQRLPYISRHGIIANADYSLGQEYSDPDTGPTGYFAACDIKERPAACAITTGIWPDGVNVILEIEPGANVLGEGGNGGAHFLYSALNTGNLFDMRPGDGGHAFDIQYPISINNKGIIAGGGGGGVCAASLVGLQYAEGGSLQTLPFAYVAGGAGAGYRIGGTAELFAYNQSADSPVDFGTTAINYTQPGSGAKLFNGNAGQISFNNAVFAFFNVGKYEQFGGTGGALANAGGTGLQKIPGLLINNTIGTGMTGRPGYAIKDGKEMITWVQKGDVRGAEF